MAADSLGQIVQALRYAARQHRHQRRKGADETPYINHPIELLDLLHNQAGVTDPVVLVSALLHDTIEDTDTTLAEIESTFGPEVAGVVDEVSDDKSLPKAERKQLQIDHAAHLSDRAKLIKLADKTSNLRDIALSPPQGWSQERLAAYCDWTKQVIDPIRGTHAKLEELYDQAYSEAYAVVQPENALQ